MAEEEVLLALVEDEDLLEDLLGSVVSLDFVGETEDEPLLGFAVEDEEDVEVLVSLEDLVEALSTTELCLPFLPLEDRLDEEEW